jgi:hypothetical protein
MNLLGALVVFIVIFAIGIGIVNSYISRKD